ncbi:iron-containing alcohol dehydrogenase [Anaerocolumna sp. AGMB13025]|uniref:iron-containing alcohol dehydrogenase n=1 Tax=Anaerocolumna sp. AGMB13025 TaxID=3039116 RepID=UPI00241E98DF|nr:iron-containing alcohol dehydrogenase [Anaerocolumna sp. AGMB13025]WFR58320.1 iron-containing alcohol dehydrogenase [Anaerocolumna sp. AGMB13025]
MPEQYMLLMPHKVIGGSNALEQIEGLLKGKYKKAAVFTDKGIHNSGIIDYPLELLGLCNLEIIIFDELPTEPSCDEAQKVVDDFRRSGADLIVGIGGGSVMDVAKLASIAATDTYGVRDLLDKPFIGRKFADVLLIPTTAGTGSEATPNSIVTVPEKNLKVGIVNAEMLADMVILDGRMLKNLPQQIAASTGIDALAHAIECYTSNKANPISNMFAMEALKLIFDNIIPACEDPGAVKEKNSMLLAAFYAGAAITASGTTAVHALSYPLGGRYHIPHGISNAIMLLPVLKFNRPSCLKELEEIYDTVSKRNLNVRQEEKAEWVLNKISEIIRTLKIPSSLRSFGINTGDLEALVQDGMQVKRLLNNNKTTVTAEDARKLYLEVMQ